MRIGAVASTGEPAHAFDGSRICGPDPAESDRMRAAVFLGVWLVEAPQAAWIDVTQNL